VELAAAYRAAGEGLDVGGDFYDVFATGDQHWCVVIGDVCGKGAEAAAVTARARYTIRTAAGRQRSPARILRSLSEVMLGEDQTLDGRFVTIACVHLDLSQGHPRATIACGGHPLPLLVHPDGRAHEVGAPGTLLGLLPDPTLPERTVELGPGDVLVLYTDGLTEAGAPQHILTPGDLAAVAAQAAGGSASGMVQHLVGAALGRGPAPRDDLAVLALRT
jgi:serine phosphatase RsbU (regulator of sigma subunit)